MIRQTNMEYVKLGNSDLRVSRICLGCMGFGDACIGQHSWTIGEEPTREIICRSLDLGVNFFDTAITYQLGTSEQFVGHALRDMAKRDDVVVATKFLPRTEEEIQQGIDGRQHVLNNINLIMREEEREMFPFCHEENIAMTPYSALASGKLAK